MRRRDLVRQLAVLLGYGFWLGGTSPRRILGQSTELDDDATQPIGAGWAIRPVGTGDDAGLVAVMQASVADVGAFNGQCAPLEWTTDWAQWVITSHPASLVATWNGQVLAFLDLPPKKPVDPNLDVERNQQAFWCAAGGVRSDLLRPNDALSVFFQLLYQTFVQARNLGFEWVRCAAPWEKHPSLPLPFAEYPALTVSPFTSDEGEQRYLIEWHLVDAIAALASQGATNPLPQVQIASAMIVS